MVCTCCISNNSFRAIFVMDVICYITVNDTFFKIICKMQIWESQFYL
jgi:hypothetical protein